MFQILLPSFLGQVPSYIAIHRHHDATTILHVKLCEDRGDIGFLTETDYGTIFIALDFDVK